MPPKKKQGGRTNKKKGKGQAGFARGSGGRPASAAKDPSATGLRRIPNLPTFHSKEKNDRDRTSSIGSTAGGYYEIYKRSTQRFWEWMKQTLPGSKMDGVNDLRKGADRILERNIESLDEDPPDPIVPPTHVMDDLSTSIQYRQLLTETKYGETGGDRGHQYMIGVLRHCQSVLRFGRHVARVAVVESHSKDVSDDKEAEERYNDGIGGRFNALILEDADEDEDIEALENDIRERKFPTFDPPEKPEQDLGIEQDLINGDARFQAIALLRTMDDFMSAVDGHYGLLKNSLRGQMKQEGSIIQMFMECAAVANLATESIQVAESTLSTNHPHLSSFYHVLALVFLTNHVVDLQKMIDPSKLEEKPHMALHFVAELLECSFHNRGQERVPAKLKRFVKKSGLTLASVDKISQEILILTSWETQLAVEEPMHAERNRSIVEATGMTPHSWLSHNKYIGGDRCILNTQKIIQMLMDAIQDDTKLVGKPGFWGESFEENTNPARRIRGDLDEAFAGSIMPDLIEICKQAPFHRLPERSQLITVLDLLQQHINGDRTSPVPVALSFGIHTMLTSIFVLQGDGDLARMASSSKQSYNKLFAQLDDLSNQNKPPKNAPNFYMNVEIFKNLVNFAKPVTAEFDRSIPTVDLKRAEQLAFWNPVIGGEYMLYATYICSIGLGSATVDSMGQLRFTLHLYNALKEHRPNFDVPFLNILDNMFTKTKAVWVAGRPQKGSYAKHFWMAWGMSATEASRMDSTNSDGNSSFPSFIRNENKQGSNVTRKLVEICPEEYSASYRRLVQHDFVDDEGVAEYTIGNGTTDETKKHLEGIIGLLTRVNMTRDSMDDDGDGDDLVLSTNLSAVGVVLLEFTHSLSQFLGWDANIDQVIRAYPEDMRTGKTMGGRHVKPGGFNASDLNLKRQGMAHFWASLLSRLDRPAAADDDDDDEVMKAAAFIEDFFQGISKERYTFFVDQDTTATLRNPLKGTYPYGRTGKTAHDPLQGFCHFKYSKAGAPVVRFIKPGRYTPYHTTESGDVATPYEECGSKMKREASWKYRHIASYSMEELLALGWDGAMYTSTKGRHAAVGHHVPFVVGYDSDADDEYEPIDLQAGKRAGIIDLPPEDVGLFMELPNLGDGRPKLVTIKNAR